MPAEVREAAQQGALEAVERLRALLRNDATPAAAAVLAARELLDRAYGRARPEEIARDGPALPVDRTQLWRRLLFVFWGRIKPVPRAPGDLEDRFRLPDGRVLSYSDASEEVDDWRRVVCDGLFGPEVGLGDAAPVERHADDHFTLEQPDG